jgi:hypothetical protein
MAVLHHPSLAIVATTKGIVDQTVYNGERNTMHFIQSCNRACAVSISIITDRGAEGRSWTSLELDWRRASASFIISRYQASYEDLTLENNTDILPEDISLWKAPQISL